MSFFDKILKVPGNVIEVIGKIMFALGTLGSIAIIAMVLWSGIWVFAGIMVAIVAFLWNWFISALFTTMGTTTRYAEFALEHFRKIDGVSEKCNKNADRIQVLENK